MANLKNKLNNIYNIKNNIKDVIEAKLEESIDDDFASYPEYIADIETGTDTSDATATSDDILVGKTAYVDGQKLTGTFPDLSTTVTALENQVNELTSALNGKASSIVEPNVYVQATEPLNKNGIWIQTDDYQMNGIVADEDIFENESWNTTKTASLSAIPYKFQGNNAVKIGDYVYLFGGSGGTTTAYKYHILTDTYTQLADIPYSVNLAATVAIGTNVYIIGSYSNQRMFYKYDTLTDTYTQLTNLPGSIYSFSSATVGTNIYMFCMQVAYKYDTLTDTFTTLTNVPYNFTDGATSSIGTNIYLFGGSRGYYNAYKYDTLTNTYTKLTNIPFMFSNGATISVGSDIYIFMSTTAYKYNSITNTYTKLTNIPTTFTSGGVVVIGDDKELYLFNTKVQVFELNSADYEDNQVVISQGVAKYVTNIINNDAGLKYWFNNAWIYTEQDGLITGLPTYYGNGSSWIKFKN